MRVVGFAATALVLVFVLAFIALLLLSLPDINRYRRLRRM